MGNGYVEPQMISQMLKPYYYFGLLQAEQIEIVKPLLTAFQKDVDANNSAAAKTVSSFEILILFLNVVIIKRKKGGQVSEGPDHSLLLLENVVEYKSNRLPWQKLSTKHVTVS